MYVNLYLNQFSAKEVSLKNVLLSLLCSIFLVSPIQAKDLDNVSDGMIIYTFFVQEDAKFVNALHFPISSNITKDDLVLLKYLNQMYPQKDKEEVEYRDIGANKCQKITNSIYTIKAIRKGWLTTVEQLASGRVKNHMSAHHLGKDAGVFSTICIEEGNFSCGSKGIKEFNFKGCKAISLEMNEDFIVAKYKVNDSMEMKRIDVRPSKSEPSKGSRVIAR